MLGKSISKNTLILGTFALVTAGLLALTFSSTKDRITKEEKRAAEQALNEIIPKNRHDNDLLNDIWQIPADHLEALGLESEANIHIARNNSDAIAIIIPAVAPDGYSGDIKMIIGVNADGSVAGVRVLAHKETPGLGDKIDIKKSSWIESFKGQFLTEENSDSWKVKKDGGNFDQFTGATITPRAVVNRVKLTLEYYQKHRTDILGEDDAVSRN